MPPDMSVPGSMNDMSSHRIDSICGEFFERPQTLNDGCIGPDVENLMCHREQLRNQMQIRSVIRKTRENPTSSRETRDIIHEAVKEVNPVLPAQENASRDLSA
jgi:hypothetical protein